MAAYRRVYDSRHLQADYQEPEPYAQQSSMGYIYLYSEGKGLSWGLGYKVKVNIMG